MRTFGFVSSAKIFAAVLAALGLCACAQQQTAQVERPQMLQAASTSLLAGKYDDAVVTYTDFLAASPGPELMAEGYVGRGNAYFKLTKYDLAEADYRAALSQTRERSTKAQATVGMADCAYALEHFDIAERLYRQILKSYVGLVPQDEVTYHLALSLVRQSKWDEGKELLEQVIASWPSGDISKRAKAKLPSANEKFFTVQIGAFTNKVMADSALKDLKSKGFAGTLESIDIEGEPAFAVRAGRFSSWKAAAEHADKLKTAGFSTYKLP